MQTFKVNKQYEIVCQTLPTRVAFKHVATLLRNGQEVDSTKICYQNRTWERYRYESVLSKIISKAGILDVSQQRDFLDSFAR